MIAGAVFLTLHNYALGTSVAPGNADVHGFFLPNHCFLGASLRSGTIPAWNPFQMAGIPFAADPQSGWLYGPAMVLYAALPCARAMPLFLFLQPLLAALGLHAFLRVEGLSRVAATCGGLVLGLSIAGTTLTIAPSFSGTLAWTAVTLAATARYFTAPSSAGRCVWVAAAALSWGQIAAAHFSHGFLLGSGAVAAYVIVVLLRSGDRKKTIAWCALLAVAVIAVNLALFAPRIAYLPRTSLALGYDELRRLGAWAPGDDLTDLPGPTWPLSFATSPGVYAGALALVLWVGSVIVRGPRRDLAIAFSSFGFVCFVLGTASFAVAVEPFVRSLPLGDFYMRAPLRFAYGLLLAVAVASAVGIDAWRNTARTTRDRVLLLVPGLFIWGLLPPLAGARAMSLWLFLIGCAAGGLALAGTVLRPLTAIALPLVLAAELTANAALGQRATEYEVDGIVRTRSVVWRYHQLVRPQTDLSAYVRDPAMESLDLRGGRLMTIDPFIWSISRPMLFGIEEAHGYNPVQLRRYWHLVHRRNPERIRYYTGVFLHPSPALYELFNVAVARGNPERLPAAAGAVEHHDMPLVPIDAGGDRAVFRTRWEIASSEEESLQAVADPRFSFRGPVILEEEPDVEGSADPEASVPVTYLQRGPQHARLILDAPQEGIVVVKNSFDRHWRASVNGRPAPVLVADHVIQAVPVEAGHQVIDLTYDDPWIRRGAAGSMVAVMVLLSAAAVLRRRSRHDARRDKDAP